MWNSLAPPPEDIVTAESLNSFKNKLDKHWHFQKLRFNCQSHRNRKRSKVEFFRVFSFYCYSVKMLASSLEAYPILISPHRLC